MSFPANIRVNVQAPFPSIAKGSGGIGIQKIGGVWTVSLDFSTYINQLSVPDPTTTYALVWDSNTNNYTAISLSAIAGLSSVKIIKIPGPYTVLPTDRVIIIKQDAPAAFTVNVDWASRSAPLRVVDGLGDASSHNISIVPIAGQTQLSKLNYTYVIDQDGGSVTLTPLPDGSGAY